MKKALLALTGMFLFGACASPTVNLNTGPTPTPSPGTVTPGTQSTSSYTLDQVRLHNTTTDCWVIIDNGVYNLTPLLSFFSDTSAIARYCGQDVSVVFKAKPTNGQSILDQLGTVLENARVGELQPTPTP